MNGMSPAQMVEAYIQLRDHVKAVEDAVKEELKRPREAMDRLEALMLDHLNQTGAKSLACDKGTVYRNTQMSATVENREVFKHFVIKNDLWEAMDIRANKTFVREYMEQKGEEMPGLKVTQLATVGVRRS